MKEKGMTHDGICLVCDLGGNPLEDCKKEDILAGDSRCSKAYIKEDRAMSKPIIFISHASEDSDLVTVFRNWLDETFIGAISFFASCDSIIGGKEWVEEIKRNLKAAQVVLLFVTRKFLTKQWCLFEAGGAFFRDIPVIPLCYTDVTIANLPFPLKIFQGYELKRCHDLERLVKQIAEVNQLRLGEFDCSKLQSKLNIPNWIDEGELDIEDTFF